MKSRSESLKSRRLTKAEVGSREASLFSTTLPQQLVRIICQPATRLLQQFAGLTHQAALITCD